MFYQLTARIPHFNRTDNMLDRNNDCVALPPVPFISEADAFDSVDLLNAEPTPGQSSDVDALGEDADDVQFPRLYLPTDDSAISEPQGTLAMLDAGASSDISGFSSAPTNFDFPSFPTDWDLTTTFNHTSIVDEGVSFQATGSTPNPRLVSEDSFTLQFHPGTHLDDLACSPELMLDMPQLSPGLLESCPSSVFSTPGPVTPISSVSTLSLSPVEELHSPSTLWDPQPCLAAPTFSNIIETIQEPFVEENGSLVPPLFNFTQAKASTSSSSSSDNHLPSPTLPSDSFIQKPSSTGAKRSSHKKAKPTALGPSRTQRTSSSAATKEKNKYLPCTHDDCPETFYDNRVLRRHLQTVHGNGSRWHCPGSCGKAYTRDDALNRHLNSVDEQSSCQIAARTLGWHPHERCSVRKLRVVVART